MDKEKIMNLCQQIGLVAMSNKKHYPALHSDFDFINDAQMDIFREITAPPKSNADSIRQMTDEELSAFLGGIADNCSYNTCDNCPMCGACVDVPLSRDKWLKQEVKTND